jgi:uncharacterized protein
MAEEQTAAEQTLLSLASRTMAQLRELARSSGLGSGYSAMGRSQLLDALQEVLAADTAVASAPDPVERTAAAPTAASAPAPQVEPASSVSFLPRDPQWASVSWHLSSADRERARAAGAQQLCLRVVDVTGLPAGASHPHTFQELAVDGDASGWYLPVPLCERDYRVELGYRLSAGGWLSLAFSAVARVPAEPAAAGQAPVFVPFAIQPAEPLPVAPPAPASRGGVDHERFYQQAMAASPRRLRVGSEEFQDHAAGPEGASQALASGAGVWASGLTASGAGPARARSFWLVVDAELIVYGATEPSATLTIGEREVPLAADGTFRLQAPFADGEQLYPIRAVSQDGEQQRSIQLDFQRQTPLARVNSREQASLEWF